MAGWTSKYAIMRDLAEAQGFDVPADPEGIGANEKPPALSVTEETGEDYFGHCEGEGDCGEPPDLALIQHMLDMVRDVGISKCEEGEEDSPEQVVQISKPYKMNIGKDITNTKTETILKTDQKSVESPVKKVKKKRENVAVNSILLAMAADTPIMNMERPKEPLKLLKPTDFISESTDTEMVQSVEKVKGWLDTQVPPTVVSRFSGNPLLVEPGSMFKRKSASTVKSSNSDSVKSTSPQKLAATIPSYKPSIVPTQGSSSSVTKSSGYPLALEPISMFKRKSTSTVKSPESDRVKSSPTQQQDPSTIGTFKPSKLADKYYNKYVEWSNMNQMVQEDVWTRAERIMKEIDAKKLTEAEAAAKEAAILESTKEVTTDKEAETAINNGDIDTVTDETVEITPEAKIPDTLEFIQEENRPSRDALCRDIIELPQHRHLLTGECIVCKVVSAHGYDVDAEIYGNAK